MKDFNITDASKHSLTGEKFSINHSFSDNEIFIIFVSSGKCKIEFNNTQYNLNSGDFLLSTSKGSLSYRFSDSHDGVFYFVCAVCDDAENVPCTFSLSQGVHHTFDTRSVKIAFAKIIREFSIKSSFSSIRLPLLFTELLCTLSEATTASSKAIQEALRLAEDINRDYLKDIDVSTYSDRVGLSKDRFSVIFREQFGYAPYKYQLMLKMKEATFLLTHTDLPIAKISQMLRFSNQLYFSSAYRAQIGCSPTQMRNHLR